MKIRYKHALSLAEADGLIEKYYDGLTSVAEEKELRSFLSQPRGDSSSSATLPSSTRSKEISLVSLRRKRKSANLRFS